MIPGLKRNALSLWDNRYVILFICFAEYISKIGTLWISSLRFRTGRVHSSCSLGYAVNLARKDCSPLKPTVLIVTTSRWFPTARLAVALANAGCNVAAVCPSGHPIAKTTVVTRILAYRGLAPLRSIAVAIRATNPDLLVS